jgi:hypothetical protein
MERDLLQALAHALRDAELAAEMLKIDEDHGGRYGIDHIHAELAKRSVTKPRSTRGSMTASHVHQRRLRRAHSVAAHQPPHPDHTEASAMTAGSSRW